MLQICPAIYQIVQAHVKKKDKFTYFVLCVAHSLNFIRVDGSEMTQRKISCFDKENRKISTTYYTGCNKAPVSGVIFFLKTACSKLVKNYYKQWRSEESNVALAFSRNGGNFENKQELHYFKWKDGPNGTC